MLQELLRFGPIRYVKVPLDRRTCFVMFMHYDAAQRAYDVLSSGGEEFRYIKVHLLDERIGHLEITSRDSYKRWKESFQPHAVALFPRDQFREQVPHPLLPHHPTLFFIPDMELELFAVDQDTLSLPRLPDSLASVTTEEEENERKLRVAEPQETPEKEDHEAPDTNEKTQNAAFLKEIGFRAKMQGNLP